MSEELAVGDEVEVLSGLFRWTKVRIKELRPRKQMVLCELITERHGYIKGDLMELPYWAFSEKDD